MARQEKYRKKTPTIGEEVLFGTDKHGSSKNFSLQSIADAIQVFFGDEPSTNIGNKADRPTSYSEDNIQLSDADGNIKDSGKSIETSLTDDNSKVPTSGGVKAALAVLEANIEENTSAISDLEDTKAEKTDVESNTSLISSLDADKADKSNVLEKDNSEIYSPTDNYHPATKKFVEDTASNLISGRVGTWDLTPNPTYSDYPSPAKEGYWEVELDTTVVSGDLNGTSVLAGGHLTYNSSTGIFGYISPSEQAVKTSDVDQTIDGNKTFSNAPIVPDITLDSESLNNKLLKLNRKFFQGDDIQSWVVDFVQDIKISGNTYEKTFVKVVNRNYASGTLYAIQIAYYDTTLTSYVILASWTSSTYTEPDANGDGKIIDTIEIPEYNDSGVTVGITVDWSAITDNTATNLVNNYQYAWLRDEVAFGTDALDAFYFRKKTELFKDIYGFSNYDNPTLSVVLNANVKQAVEGYIYSFAKINKGDATYGDLITCYRHKISDSTSEQITTTDSIDYGSSGGGIINVNVVTTTGEVICLDINYDAISGSVGYSTNRNVINQTCYTYLDVRVPENTKKPDLSLWAAGTFQGVSDEDAARLKLGIVGIVSDKMDATKYYSFYRIRYDEDFGWARFYLAEMSDKTTEVLLADVIGECRSDLSGLPDFTSNEIVEVDITEFNSSGFTGKAYLNYYQLGNSLHIAPTNTFNKVGLNHQYFSGGMEDKKIEQYGYLKETNAGNKADTQYAKRDGQDLYIRSKWNSAYDIIFKYGYTTVNGRYKIESVGLVASAGIVGKDVTEATTITLKSIASSQTEVGAYLVTDTDDHWIGGNHLYNNGVDDFNTSALVSVDFYVDGKPMADGVLYECDNVQIIAKHECYQPTSTPDATNTVWINETNAYSINRGTVTLSSDFELAADIVLKEYNGLQTVYNAFTENIYYAHSNDNTIQTYPVVEYSAGSFATYPNSEKCVIMNADKSYMFAMELDFNSQLGDRSMLITENDVQLTTTSKSYFPLIRNASTLLTGNRYSFRGWHTYAPHISGDFDIAYVENRRDGKYLNIDNITSTTGTKRILVPDVILGDVEVISKDSTLTIETIVRSDGVEVVCTGYGNAKLKIK